MARWNSALTHQVSLLVVQRCSWVNGADTHVGVINSQLLGFSPVPYDVKANCTQEEMLLPLLEEG